MSTYYKPYVSGSESGSDSDTGSTGTTGTTGTRGTSGSYSNASANFVQLAKNLLTPAIAGPVLDISSEVVYQHARNYALYGSSNDEITTGITSALNVPPPVTALFTTTTTQVTSIINMDSTNRDKQVYPQPTAVQLRLPRTYTKIINFQVVQIKLLSAFYYFRNAKQNITITINEQGRFLYPDGSVVTGSDVTNPSVAKVLNSITNTIRQGSYDILSLINELTIQLNTAPIFYDFVGGFNQFVLLFAATGDLSLGFNLPGDYYYDSVINNYIANPTIDTIVTKYFAQRYAGLTGYTINQIKVAYYYPVLKEILLDNNYHGTAVDLSNANVAYLLPGETPYSRCVFYFQGLNDLYVQSVIATNVSVLDTYRLQHTFRYSLVNKYVISYDTFSQHITINTPSLNTSLVNLINNKQTLYFNQQLAIYNITATQFADLTTQNTLLLAILTDLYNFLQTQFALGFAINFNTFTLDYYGQMSNYVYLRSGSNASGVSSTYDINVITSGSIPISNNLPTFYQKGSARYWPGLASNASSNFAGNTNVTYYSGNPFNLQTDSIESYHPLIDVSNNIYCSKLLNHVDTVVNINNASYTVFKFDSSLRQTLQVETLPRPTKYRYPDYNAVTYETDIQNLFNNSYTYQYNQSNIALVNPAISVTTIPGFGSNNSNFGITLPASIALWTSPVSISVISPEIYFSFVPPLPAAITPSIPAYKYTMGLNISCYPLGTLFPSQLDVFMYRDAAAFYADISGSRSESPFNYLTSNLITTDLSSATIFFNTYQTSLALKYYVIIRSQTTGPALTNIIIPAFTNSSYVATCNSLSNFNPLADPQLNLNNFLYNSYDTDYVALPCYSNLYQANPLVNTLFSNIGYSNDIPLGYDASGISTDLTNYIGYIQNQPTSNDYPYSILHVDPITGYVFRKAEGYNPATQTYFYPGTGNKLFTPNSVAAYTPGNPTYRQYTQTQYYATSYLPNSPNQPPLESFFISPYIGPYNTSNFSNSLNGYKFDVSGNIVLGNGVYGLSLIPGQGTWDIQRYMFRSIFNQTSWTQSNIYGYSNDPNLNIRQLGIFYANVVYGKDLTAISLSNSICVLSYSAHNTFNNSNTDFGYGSEGGTFYEFTRDSNYRTGFYSYLYGFTESPNTITNDLNNAYTIIAFDSTGKVIPFIGLAGSIVPYPYYSDAIASNTYNGTPSSNGNYVIVPVTKAFPDSNRSPPSGTSPSQCQYEQSQTIGTTFQGFMSTTPDFLTANMYAYSNLGEVVDKIVMDISGYMLTQGGEFSLYSYGGSSNRSFTLDTSFTIDEIFSPPNSNVTYVGLAANENVYAFLALSNGGPLFVPNSNTLSTDKMIIRTFNPITREVHTVLETEFLIYPMAATEIQSFTYNNFGGFTLGFQYTSNTSTFNMAYSLSSGPTFPQTSVSTLQEQCFVSSIVGTGRFVTYQNPRENMGAFYVATGVSGIREFSYIQPAVPSSNTHTHLSAISGSNYVFAGTHCKITSYFVNTYTFDSLAFTRSPIQDVIYGFSLSNPTHFYELTSYSSPSSNAYDSNANFSISLPLAQPVKEMEAGFNGALWFNDTNTIYGNRRIQVDGIVFGIQYAWQIFYPVQRVIYKNITKSVNLLTDLSGLQYPELAHTELFFYKDKTSFVADLSNSSVKSTWGLESNYYITDTQFSGYYFNAYSTFIPLENSSDTYYLAVRNYSPTEKSQVYMRFSLPNRFDYGYASMIDISNEILDSLTSTQFNPNYSSNLTSFNSNFVFSAKTFGNNIVPGFYGVTLSNVTGFGDFMRYYQQYYNNYQSNIALQNAINSSVATSLSNFVATDLAYIIPPTAANRQKYTDPLLFSILWKSSLTPQYAPLEDQWGLGWNLGYAKADTPYDVIQIATSFYKILDDYITLQLNQEININRVDTGAKEKISATLEPTGETNSYYGKLLLAPFGSYAQTMIMNPIAFNPPLGKLDKLSFTWQDLTGTTIDNSDCEWNAVVQIVENHDVVQIANPPILIPR